MEQEAPGIRELASLSWALAHKQFYDKYVDMRVHGYHSAVAFRSVFPDDWSRDGNGGLVGREAAAVEFNPYVVSALRDRISTIDPKTLWNPRLAVHEMLSLARDPTAKDATRLSAMKELNILLSITIVDENGKTRATDMSAFYKDVKEITHELPKPNPNPNPNPEEEVTK